MNKEKQFDFDNVGKRMPYNVPDGFFDEMTQKLMAQAAQTKQPILHKRPVRLLLISLAAAACLALALAFHFGGDFESGTNEPGMSSEQAYNRMTEEDQEALVRTYENDVFLSVSNQEQQE